MVKNWQKRANVIKVWPYNSETESAKLVWFSLIHFEAFILCIWYLGNIWTKWIPIETPQAKLLWCTVQPQYKTKEYFKVPASLCKRKKPKEKMTHDQTLTAAGLYYFVQKAWFFYLCLINQWNLIKFFKTIPPIMSFSHL